MQALPPEKVESIHVDDSARKAWWDPKDYIVHPYQVVNIPGSTIPGSKHTRK